MPLRLSTPRAFLPLRHATFRTLWLATLASNIGMWVQNTGAGWLMTSLDPAPLMVSLVQAASMLPVFLLALPAGALADLIDRRAFLLERIADEVSDLCVVLDDKDPFIPVLQDRSPPSAA